MSIKYVTAYYVDAQDSRPANEAPLRHGPALPSSHLTVTTVDRRVTPATIIGTLPASTPLTPGMTLIDQEEHDRLAAEVAEWQETNAQREIDKARAAMVVTSFQAFAALDAGGYLDQVEVMMADPETPRIHRLAFEKAQEFRRDSPTVAAWQKRLELTDEQVDELFEVADDIQA
ncbi:hypothetical protein [Vreelandella sp. EE22]